MTVRWRSTLTSHPVKLSDEQQEILSKTAPSTAVVIQGIAGSGKTLLGVTAGAKLLSYSKDWQRVLFLTYSKLAKHRISEVIGQAVDEGIVDGALTARMDVHNYHSLWWKLISDYFGFLGLCRTPMLLTANERVNRAEQAWKRVPSDAIPKSFLRKNGAPDKRKENVLIDPLNGEAVLYAAWGPEHFGQDGKELVDATEFLEWAKKEIRRRNEEGEFSHAETVWWAHRLLTTHPNVLPWLQEKYPFLVVDEFQDTDVAQWEMVKLLAPKTLVALADSAQTIHYWRGSDPNRVDQLIEFCSQDGVYREIHACQLTKCYRSSKVMSESQNVEFVELGVSAGNRNQKQMNLAKKHAKFQCKDLAINALSEGKSIAFLCRTNAEADDIDVFLRSSQGSMPPINCARLGAENSPFEGCRELILGMMQLCSKGDPDAVCKFLANDALREAIGVRLDNCTPRSTENHRKQRWQDSRAVSIVMLNHLGQALQQFARLAEAIAAEGQAKPNRALLGCIRHVGRTVARYSHQFTFDPADEREREIIDNAVLQYEHALTKHFERRVLVMTIHQSKGRELDIAVIPWFTDVPWNPGGHGWNTNDTQDANLFHTACTRARDRAVVIYPQGQRAAWPPSTPGLP